MTLQEYLTSLRHKTVAVIGIGVSNTPLLRRLLAEGIAVTACDRSSREKLGPLADELEAAGATLHLGEGYLDGLTQDVIFRTPGLRPDVPQLLAAQRQGDHFDIQVIPMERGKVYNVPQETWFNTITQKDTKLVYVQDAGTTAQNSEYQDMTQEELEYVRTTAKQFL